MNGVSLATYEADSRTFAGIFSSAVSDTLGHDIEPSNVIIVSVTTAARRTLAARQVDKVLIEHDYVAMPFNNDESPSPTVPTPTTLMKKTFAPSHSTSISDATDTIEETEAIVVGMEEAADDDVVESVVPSLSPTYTISTSVSMSYDVEISNITGFSSAGEAVDVFSDILISSVEDGNFTATLRSYAAQLNATAFLDVSSDSIAISAPTSLPTLLPTTSPTWSQPPSLSPTMAEVQVAGLYSIVAVVFLLTFIVPCVAVIYARHRQELRKNRIERVQEEAAVRSSA